MSGIDPRKHRYYSQAGLDQLAEVMDAERPAPRCVVEIGSGVGDSARTLARHAGTDSVTWSIDPYRFGRGDAFLAEFYRRTSPHEQVRKVVQVRMGSAEAAARWPRMCGELIDVLHIDGDHASKAVNDDITLWHPHVKTGGLYVGHDWDTAHDGVRRAVTRAVENGWLESLRTWPCAGVWAARRADR